LSTAPAKLPFTVRDVVADCVAEDVVERGVFGDVTAGLGDDGYQLAFVV